MAHAGERFFSPRPSATGRLIPSSFSHSFGFNKHLFCRTSVAIFDRCNPGELCSRAAQPICRRVAPLRPLFKFAFMLNTLLSTESITRKFSPPKHEQVQQ